MNKKKRTWMYVQKPWEYEISCDKCHGHNLEWSEFQGYVWCKDCQIDTRGDKGVFNGPIPIEVSKVLGMCFDVLDIEKKQIIKFEDYKNGKNKRYNQLTRDSKCQSGSKKKNSWPN